MEGSNISWRLENLKTFLLNFLWEIFLIFFSFHCYQLQKLYPCNNNNMCQRRTMPLPHASSQDTFQTICRDHSLTSWAGGWCHFTVPAVLLCRPAAGKWRGIFPTEWQWKFLRRQKCGYLSHNLQGNPGLPLGKEMCWRVFNNQKCSGCLYNTLTIGWESPPSLRSHRGLI